MDYRFRQAEKIPAAAERIITALFEKARRQLNRPADESAEAIHECRKRLKELRGLLRLVRYHLPVSDFRSARDALRDLGHLFAETRDAAVMAETLASLRPTVESDGYEVLLVRLREEARRKEEALFTDCGRTELTAALERTSGIMSRLRFRHQSSPLVDALESTYRRGMDALTAAYVFRTDESMHAWRKRVKALWYHIQLLSPAAPPVLDPLAAAFHTLSDLLGRDHDLAVLQAALNGGMPEAPNSLAASVDVAIAAERQDLQAKAERLGGILYAEKPEAFAKRLDAYWREWRTNPRVKL